MTLSRTVPPEVDALDVESLPVGQTTRLMLRLTQDPLGRNLCLPLLVARGTRPGPTLGVIAAVHGNELNGIPVVHQLMRTIHHDHLRGTIVGCPIVNVPAYMNHVRTLREGMDLNRLMPGKEKGNVGQVYAYRLLQRLIRKLDFLVDLHTASFGRINSLYVRADLTHPIALKMATLQGPEIIVHNAAADGTVRGEAMSQGIPAITVEVGNPQRFQRRLIQSSLRGIENILYGLDLYDEESHPADEAVVCGRSFWMFAEHGGLLEVFPDVTHRVDKDERIARVTNIFGDTVAEYFAPQDGVVVGRSTDPVCEPGARLLHLGVEGTPSVKPKTP